MFNLNKNDYRMKEGDRVYSRLPGCRCNDALLFYRPNARNKYGVLLGITGGMEISDDIERTIKRCKFVLNENKSNLFNVGDVVINSANDNYFNGRAVVVGILAQPTALSNDTINYVVRIDADNVVIIPADHIELYEG